ncbi:MAG: type II toxin-antitoxin system VapC family toxin [Dysgonamonadaceae bacterium]|jgi:PIN domain nuclease of toxin-antitoxin system|nr:type II toxin-antitoxin system VapC family toxin [Dysgonamonadaceae bacterium]
MRYIIDTNVFINLVIEDYVSNDVRAILYDYENMIFISSESIKEFIHLVQEGRVVLNKNFRSLDVFDLIENEFGLTIKYVSKEHLLTFAKLETVEGHNDPNDRLIISQAIAEKVPLINSDTKFPKYVKYGLNFVSNR